MRSVRLFVPSGLLMASGLLVSAGCASDKDHVDKQLSKLSDEVRHLQSETDRMTERLDAMESRQASAPRYPEEREDRVASNASAVTRPKLKIVHMEPGDGSSPDDVSEANAPAPADDTGPRVVIQGEGKSVESRTVGNAAPPAAKSSRPDGSKAHKPDSAAK